MLVIETKVEPRLTVGREAGVRLELVVAYGPAVSDFGAGALILILRHRAYLQGYGRLGVGLGWVGVWGDGARQPSGASGAPGASRSEGGCRQRVGDGGGSGGRTSRRG